LDRDSVPETWNTDLHVRRWQVGDDSAFAALEEHFRPLLLSRVRFGAHWALLRRYFEAEDVIQEVWLKVHNYAKTEFTPAGKGSFHALLRTICDRTMHDLVDSQTAQKRGGGSDRVSLGEQHHDQVIVRPGIAAPETPTSAARVAEEMSIARRVLSRREFLAWKHFELEDYLSDEVGDLVLDCPASTVRRLVMQARAKLARRV